MENNCGGIVLWYECLYHILSSFCTNEGTNRVGVGVGVGLVGGGGLWGGVGKWVWQWVGKR